MPDECGVGNSNYTAKLPPFMPVPAPTRKKSDISFAARAAALPVLATERLVLRPFCALDVSPLWLLLADGRISANALGPTGTQTDLCSEYNFAVTGRYVDQLLGAVTLRPGDQRDTLAYWIGAAWWKQGYATEAARAVTAWAFETLKLDSLGATHLRHNIQSGRVLEKLGMQHIDSTSNQDHDGTVHAFEVYAITRAQWVRVTSA